MTDLYADEDFLKTKLRFAVVCYATLDEIQRLKQLVLDTGISVVYQRTSADKLYILRDGEAVHDNHSTNGND